MSSTMRRYEPVRDFGRVSEFLVRTCDPTATHVNWLQPRWEYMHYHPLIRRVDLSRIGIWEVDGRIIGVSHPEHDPGLAYFEVEAGFDAIKPAMIQHAADHFAVDAGNDRRLRLHLGEHDAAFHHAAAELGFSPTGETDPVSSLDIPTPMDPPPLPTGFRLRGRDEADDLVRLNQVLWRGFNHDGDPPPESIADRTFMQSAPNYRKELNVVAETLDGRFVAYCGMWYEPIHRIAYVEPVATDPDYRRRGLGRAVVLEGVRRCGELGARCAYVATTKPFYLALGFRQAYASAVWVSEE